MAWYAAHIISYVKFLDGVQDAYTLWENIVLIEAATDDDAFELAEQIGRSDYDGGELTQDDRPGVWVFAGVRKLMACSTVASHWQDTSDPSYRPGHGTEVTYSQLEIADAETFAQFVAGKAVKLLYDE